MGSSGLDEIVNAAKNFVGEQSIAMSEAKWEWRCKSNQIVNGLSFAYRNRRFRLVRLVSGSEDYLDG